MRPERVFQQYMYVLTIIQTTENATVWDIMLSRKINISDDSYSSLFIILPSV